MEKYYKGSAEVIVRLGRVELIFFCQAIACAARLGGIAKLL